MWPPRDPPRDDDDARLVAHFYGWEVGPDGELAHDAWALLGVLDPRRVTIDKHAVLVILLREQAAHFLPADRRAFWRSLRRLAPKAPGELPAVTLPKRTGEHVYIRQLAKEHFPTAPPASRGALLLALGQPGRGGRPRLPPKPRKRTPKAP